MPIPLAFSVHHFVSSVGADAGFAAIIGIAVLVLLHFAQARETSALRERAMASEQHAAQLEGRLVQLARSQAAPAQSQAAPNSQAPQSAPVVAAPGPQPVAASPGTPPVPPAGVGAPALSAATRLIPAPQSGAPRPAGAGPSIASPALPPPVTAGGANGAPQVPFSAQPRSGRSAPPPARAGTRQRPRHFRGRRVLVGLLAAAAAAAIVGALLLVTGSGGVKQASNRSTPTTNAPANHHRSRSSAVNPSSVTVAVLNGTSTGGLGRRVAAKLGGAGYKQGTVTNATDQTRTATVVAYLPGYKRDALAAASALKLSSASVAPVDSSTQAVACPPTAGCAANVVVTVGADLAGIH